MGMPGIRGKRTKFRMDCIREEHGKRWPSEQHRRAFIRVIPDLLVCLDDLRMKNQLVKDKAIRQLGPKLKDTGVDYERVHERITQAKYVLITDFIQGGIDVYL